MNFLNESTIIPVHVIVFDASGPNRPKSTEGPVWRIGDPRRRERVLLVVFRMYLVDNPFPFLR